MKTLTIVLMAVCTVLLQSAVVNRMPLPGGIAPDLVVLLVTVIALRSSPAAGAITGFAAGLAMDALPPADHEIGRYAMVLCAAGYVIGLLRDSGARSGLRSYLMAGAAALGVSIGFTFVGLALGEPRTSLVTAAATTVLTAAATMIISPLVLHPAAKLLRYVSADEFSELEASPWRGVGIRP